MADNSNRPDYADFDSPAKFQAIEAIIARRLREHPNAHLSYSGGADSDTVLDLVERVRHQFNLPPIRYVFFNTGLEMRCTKEHITEMEKKYGIEVEVIRPKMSIVTAVRKYGMPFMSKIYSECFEKVMSHGVPFDTAYEFKNADDKLAKINELYERYPGTHQGLQFLCSCNKYGEPICCQSVMDAAPYLLDFIVENPPNFTISAKCCNYCKKQPAHEIEKQTEMTITGERKQEGGLRSINYNGGTTATCFTQTAKGRFRLRPLYYVTDVDKAWYKERYGLHYSDAYEVYGMKRTGCCGCPINARATQELELIRPYEPNLVKAAWNIFGDSYRYRAAYNEYRAMRRQQEKDAKTNSEEKEVLR